MKSTTKKQSGRWLVCCIGMCLTVLIQANPVLTPGVWTEITPAAAPGGDLNTCLGQGITVHPTNPSILFWCNGPYMATNGGLFKTTNGGSTWTRVAKVKPAWTGASDHIDIALHVRINPKDPRRIYCCDGVRGSSQGFFISDDGGDNFTLPQGFLAVLDSAKIDNRDIYDVAVDPSDFNHVLLSFHYRWGWTETKWNTNSGILESKDGGDHWRVIEPKNGWGSGHSIKFLYDPGKGIGNASTWLLGTQGNGFWRTTDAGATWTQVTPTNIAHGGGTIYYTRTGTLYASGEKTLRSTDNGATWQDLNVGSSWCVHGDGTTLYTGAPFSSGQTFKISAETDGTAWSASRPSTNIDGPFEMAYDAVNGIMYSSNWSSGVWALKIVHPDASIRPFHPTTLNRPIGVRATIRISRQGIIIHASNGAMYNVRGKRLELVRK